MPDVESHHEQPHSLAERRTLGQSLVETAIVLPILLLLLAAVVDFGRAFDAYIVLTNAVREGARFGVNRQPPPSPAQITDIVIEDVMGSGTNISAMGGFTATNVTVITGTGGVTVTAWYDYNLFFAGLIGLPTVRLSREAVMPWFIEW